MNSLRVKLIQFLNENIWIGATVFIKAVAQIVILKSVSIYFGAAGVGYLGQVLSCITIVNSLFSVGLVNFIIVELAGIDSKGESSSALYRFISLWCFSCLAFLIIVSLLFSNYFSKLVFDNMRESLFFVSLACGFIFFNASSVAQGIFSSRKDVKSLFYLSLFSLSIGLGAFVLVIRLSQDYIPMAALAFFFAQGLVAFGFLAKYDQNASWLVKMKFDSSLMKKLLKFTSVMATTGAVGALQQVYMRNYLLTDLKLSWNDVGHWQSLLKISEINLSFIGLTMLSLYLPSISAVSTSLDLRSIATRYLKRVFIIVLVACVFINLAAPYILQIIYSEDFVFLSSLLKLQLVGDVFKLCSWIFTYFILSKLRLSLFLLIELLGLGLLTLSSVFLSRIYLIDGLIYAQVVTSLIIFTITYFIYNFYSKRDALWNK